MRSLIVVDDNKAVLAAVKLLMSGKVDEVVTTTSPSDLHRLIQRHSPGVILLDMNFRATVNTGNEGLFWLREIKKMAPDVAVVLFTAYADVALAVEGMKIGAVDFIVKPFDNRHLAATILKAFDRQKSDSRSADKLEKAVEDAFELDVNDGSRHADAKSDVPALSDSPTTLEGMERNAIIEAVRLHNGNMSEVARTLGISRQTLYNKLRKYGI